MVPSVPARLRRARSLTPSIVLALHAINFRRCATNESLLRDSCDSRRPNAYSDSRGISYAPSNQPAARSSG